MIFFNKVGYYLFYILDFEYIYIYINLVIMSKYGVKTKNSLPWATWQVCVKKKK